MSLFRAVQHKKIIWVLILVAVSLLFFLIPNSAEAAGCDWDDFGCHLRTVVIWASLWVAFFIGQFGALMFSLVSLFVDVIVKQNLNLLQFGSTDNIAGVVISKGFEFSLSIANIGFVFAIILIAFATIFRSQTYGIKQMLWKLVVAAVLVNFSLLLAGVILDFSHILTQGILEQGRDEIARVSNKAASTVTLSDGLGELIDPQSLWKGVARSWSAASGAASEGFTAMASLVLIGMFINLFLYFMVVVVAAIGIMLLVRYVYITVLLILMPLAWVFWVMPKYNHLFSKWWNKFLEQALYLPAVVFFISLSMLLVGSVSGDALRSAVTSGISKTGVSDGLVAFAINLVIILGLLVGGLIAGQKLGAAGASTAVEFADRFGVGRRSARSAGRAALRGAGYTAAAVGAAATLQRPSLRGSENVRKLAGFGEATVSRLQGIPLFGRVARRATASLGGIATQGKKDADKYRKDVYGKMRDPAFERTLKQPLPGGDVERIALLREAAKRGKIDELDKGMGGNWRAMIQSAKALGVEAEAQKINPQLAPSFASEADRTKITEELTRQRGQGAEAIENRVREKEAELDRERSRIEGRRGQTLRTVKQDDSDYKRTLLPGQSYEETDAKTGEVLTYTTRPDGTQVVTGGGVAASTFDERKQKEVDAIRSQQPELGDVRKEDVDSVLVRRAAEGADSSDAKNWTTQTLQNPAAVSGMNIGQVKTIGLSGKTDEIGALTNTLNDLRSVLERRDTGQSTSDDKQLLATLTPAQMNRLEKTVKFASENPALVREADYKVKTKSRYEDEGEEKKKKKKDDSDDE